MSTRLRAFQDKLHDARPDLAERQTKNAHKRAIAVQLRALRDVRGMTQSEVAAAAGVPQHMIARLEALTGPVPSWDSIERYVNACRGHMALWISTDELSEVGNFTNASVRAHD